MGKLSQPYSVLHFILEDILQARQSSGCGMVVFWCYVIVIHVCNCGSKMMKLKSCISSGKPSSHIISVISAYLFLVYIAMLWMEYSERTRIRWELHVCNSTIPHTVAKVIFLIIKNCFKIASYENPYLLFVFFMRSWMCFQNNLLEEIIFKFTHMNHKHKRWDRYLEKVKLVLPRVELWDAQ